MLSISPPDKMEQLITVFSQRLQPVALQRLSVAEILQDASALALMQEEIPPMDNFQVMKQQKACFGRMIRFLHLHEPTGYEKDEEHKRTAVRYLALRTMLQQCSDIKISSIQETCLDKVLRWFEKTEKNAVNSATASTPILPPRMSPKKPCFPPTRTLDKCSSETRLRPATTGSSETVASKLEKYKMPDLRASHIRRIAELKSRGADISEKSLPTQEDNNEMNYKLRVHDNLRKKEDEKRMVESTFKQYYPETDAEHEMNLLWIRRRQEEVIKRKKDEEIQHRVQKWAMNCSRDESENLRKRESTKLVAGLGQILQDGVDQEKPFAWRNSQILHPDLTGMAAQSNQSTIVASITPGITAIKATKEASPQNNGTTHKLPLQTQTQTKDRQPAQIVIKSRKPSVNAGGGGMHFRNQLPPNYVPPGLSSVPKTKREVPSATMNTRPSTSHESRGSFGRLEKRASMLSEDLSSDSEEEDNPAMDDNDKKHTKREARQVMKLQSYHVPYYYDETDHMTAWTAPAPQKPHPRGTIPVQPLPADPELRRLQEASALRRVFAIPLDKKPSTIIQSTPGCEAEVSSSRKSTRSEVNKPRGSKSAKGKRGTRSNHNSAEPQFTASTSDLRQSQMEELEKIRRLFQENNLSMSSEILERGLLVPEDRPLLQSINDLPFAGSRLLDNPLTRRSKPAKLKKKPSTSKKKKKTKKTKKKSAKTSKSSRK